MQDQYDQMEHRIILSIEKKSSENQSRMMPESAAATMNFYEQRDKHLIS